MTFQLAIVYKEKIMKYGLLSLLLCFSMFAVADQATALALYQQAEQQFEQGDLAAAQTLANKAKQLHNNDGIILTNKRHEYIMQKVGRSFQRTTQVYGDKNSYQPNQLLRLIQAEKQAQLALAQKQNKQLNPPNLVFSDIQLVDEDNDHVFSALEHGVMKITVKNIGNSTAEAVTLAVHTGNINIKGLTGEQKIGNLISGAQQELKLTFTLPKSLPNNFNNIMLKVNEKDGLGEFQQQVSIDSQVYFSPVFSVTYLPTQSETITKLQQAKVNFAITNKGLATARDVKLALNFSKRNQVNIAQNIDVNTLTLKPGEIRKFSFSLQAQDHVTTGQDLGLMLDINHRGNEPVSTHLPLMAYQSNQKNGLQANRLLAQFNQINQHKLSGLQTQHQVIALNLSPQRLVNQHSVQYFIKNLLASTDLPQQAVTQAEVHTIAQLNNVLKGADTLNNRQLHLFISGQGQHQIAQGENLLTLSEGALPMTTLITQLKRLSFNNINLYLDVDFISDEPNVSGWYLAQPVITPVPAHINIFSAALPKQKSLYLKGEQLSLFTKVLTQGLTGAINNNFQQVPSPLVLGNFIAETLPKTSNILFNTKQIPWLKLAQP